MHLSLFLSMLDEFVLPRAFLLLLKSLKVESDSRVMLLLVVLPLLVSDVSMLIGLVRTSRDSISLDELVRLNIRRHVRSG